jgi:prevent-host-death family protein
MVWRNASSHPGLSRALTVVFSCRHGDHVERSVVGARELRTRLGTYLRRVREGRTLLVTERGEPVAELRPLPPDPNVPAELLKLSSKRAFTLPVRKSMVAFRPIQSRERALSEAVRCEDRADRF